MNNDSEITPAMLLAATNMIGDKWPDDEDKFGEETWQVLAVDLYRAMNPEFYVNRVRRAAMLPTLLYDDAMEALLAHLEAHKPPKVVAEALTAFVRDHHLKLCAWVGDGGSAGDAGAARVPPGLYASDLLVKLLAAVRAFDWKVVAVLMGHAVSPDGPVGSNVEITSKMIRAAAKPLWKSGICVGGASSVHLLVIRDMFKAAMEAGGFHTQIPSPEKLFAETHPLFPSNGRQSKRVWDPPV